MGGQPRHRQLVLDRVNALRPAGRWFRAVAHMNVAPSWDAVRPTRRGLAAIVLVAATFGSATLFGARGLNAIAAPGVVALLFALVWVARLETPTLERDLPRHGEQGSTVTVGLDVEVKKPYSARLTDSVGDGLAAEGNDRDVTVGGDPIEYELALHERGDRTVGPATVEARDVLGFVRRRFEVEGTATIRVRPPVYPLYGPRAEELVWSFGGGDDRQQFDYLRLYRRGDPLRDIHWRSSAKVPETDFVVKEFSTDRDVSNTIIAAQSPEDQADKMAAAAASIAKHLLDAGLSVGLVTADVRVEAHAGGGHHERLLDALARTRGGPLPEDERARADLVVRGGLDGVMVELDSRAVTFALVAGRPLPAPPFDESRRARRAGGTP